MSATLLRVLAKQAEAAGDAARIGDKTKRQFYLGKQAGIEQAAAAVRQTLPVDPRQVVRQGVCDAYNNVPGSQPLHTAEVADAVLARLEQAGYVIEQKRGTE